MRYDRGLSVPCAVLPFIVAFISASALAQSSPVVPVSAESTGDMPLDRAAVAALGLQPTPLPSSRRAWASSPEPVADAAFDDSTSQAVGQQRVSAPPPAGGLIRAGLGRIFRQRATPSPAPTLSPEPTLASTSDAQTAVPVAAAVERPEPEPPASDNVTLAPPLVPLADGQSPLPEAPREPSATAQNPVAVPESDPLPSSRRGWGPPDEPAASGSTRLGVVRTQAVIPEIESPTTISPEPPQLFIPPAGSTYRAPDLRPQYEDDAYRNGVDFLKCQMPMAALDAMLCTPSETEDIRDAKKLATGGAFRQLNLLEEARDEYCSVLNQSRNPFLQGLARDYLVQIDQSQASREYLRGSAGFTARYDSDPGILPTFNAVGIPFHAPACVANAYFANVGYDIGRTDNSDTTIGYSLYGTQNYNQISNNYNVNQNDFFLLHRRRTYWRDTPTYLGVYIDYQYMTVGGQAFLSRPLVNPYVTFQHDDRRSTLVYGEWGSYDYLGAFNPGGPALDLDSRQGRLGVTFRRRMGASRNVMGALGYQAQVNASDGADYDFIGQSALAYLLWNLPNSGSQFVITSQYFYRDYSNVNSIVGYKRRDNEFALYATFLYPLAPKWFLTMDVGVDHNGSNVSFNRYDRVWADVGIEFRFPQSWAQRSRMIY